MDAIKTGLKSRTILFQGDLSKIRNAVKTELRRKTISFQRISFEDRRSYGDRIEKTDYFVLWRPLRI